MDMFTNNLADVGKECTKIDHQWKNVFVSSDFVLENFESVNLKNLVKTSMSFNM